MKDTAKNIRAVRLETSGDVTNLLRRVIQIQAIARAGHFGDLNLRGDLSSLFQAIADIANDVEQDLNELDEKLGAGLKEAANGSRGNGYNGACWRYWVKVDGMSGTNYFCVEHMRPLDGEQLSTWAKFKRATGIDIRKAPAVAKRKRQHA